MSAEISGLDFSHKDVVTALLKSADIHDGIWMLAVKLGLTAANLQLPGSNDLVPSGILSVMSLKIEKATELNALSVDASVVNPPPKKQTKKPRE